MIALIKRGGGMCPMKPGNRQCLLKWCQFTQSFKALADERKVFPSCLSAHMQKGIFIFTELSPVLMPWNNLELVSGNYSYGDWQDDISL